jgi:hypothetical protein
LKAGALEWVEKLGLPVEELAEEIGEAEPEEKG